MHWRESTNPILQFETSCTYCDRKSEPWLGAGLKGIRDKALVSTKSAPHNEATNTSDRVRQSIDASLERLGPPGHREGRPESGTAGGSVH